jgi:hypothetical protein
MTDATTTWTEPRAVSIAIARVAGAGEGGFQKLLVPIGILAFILWKTGLIFDPLILIGAVVLVVVGSMIYLGFQKTVRMKAEAVAWDVVVEQRGIVRRGSREEALPWQSVGRILLRAFPGHPHVVCGVTLTDGSEWAFGIPDHGTAEAVASLASAREIKVVRAGVGS